MSSLSGVVAGRLDVLVEVAAIEDALTAFEARYGPLADREDALRPRLRQVRRLVLAQLRALEVVRALLDAEATPGDDSLTSVPTH
jgi:hypothetical protein